MNCLTPKEWLKSQLGVWQFSYETHDKRDKNLHLATLLSIVGWKRWGLVNNKKYIEKYRFCGESFAWGSSRVANSIPHYFNIMDRAYVSLWFPEGDFACTERDSKAADDYISTFDMRSI